jgi:hypothetical protein
MITFERCHPQHITLVEPQRGQDLDREFLMSPQAWAALRGSVAISGFAEGRCIGCAGLIDTAPGTAVVWALLSKHAGRYMLPITRKVKRVLDVYPAERIEATCVPGFPERAYWLKMLGFPEKGEFEYNPLYGFNVVRYVKEKQHDRS